MKLNSRMVRSFSVFAVLVILITVYLFFSPISTTLGRHDRRDKSFNAR